jgi:hypothetical protein
LDLECPHCLAGRVPLGQVGAVRDDIGPRRGQCPDSSAPGYQCLNVACPYCAEWPGQEARAIVTLMTEDLSYWSPELRRFIDAGTYDIMVGNLSIPLSIASGAEIKTMHGDTILHPLAPPASAEAVAATSEALGPSLVDQLLAAASIANEGAGEGVSLAVREKRMRELFEDLTQHLKVPAGGQVKL